MNWSDVIVHVHTSKLSHTFFARMKSKYLPSQKRIQVEDTPLHKFPFVTLFRHWMKRQVFGTSLTAWKPSFLRHNYILNGKQKLLQVPFISVSGNSKQLNEKSLKSRRGTWQLSLQKLCWREIIFCLIKSSAARRDAITQIQRQLCGKKFCNFLQRKLLHSAIIKSNSILSCAFWNSSPNLLRHANIFPACKMKRNRLQFVGLRINYFIHFLSLQSNAFRRNDVQLWLMLIEKPLTLTALWQVENFEHIPGKTKTHSPMWPKQVTSPKFPSSAWSMNPLRDWRKEKEKSLRSKHFAEFLWE